MDIKNNINIIWKAIHKRPFYILFNIMLVYVSYAICRVVFIAENHTMLLEAQGGLPLWSIWKGGWRYDSFAICLTNIPYILLALLPFEGKIQKVIDKVARWIFVITNATAVFVNLADVVYFPYTLERTNASVFAQFEGNTNLVPIFATEIIAHWYLTLTFIALTLFLAFAYFKPSSYFGLSRKRNISIFGAGLVVFMLFTSLSVYNYPYPKGEPLSANSAYWYTGAPLEVACVYNTPYTLMFGRIRYSQHMGHTYKTLAEAEEYYSPVHKPNATAEFKPRNIVILIVESLSESFTGYNRHSLNCAKSCTPFIDSLARVSLTYEHTFSNGIVSIDALPSIISSLPRMGESYTISQNSLSTPPSLARELEEHGYNSAFYHGGENTSMGFKAYTNQVGFDKYFGFDEYIQDSRFGDANDYDGKWAIWDEEFLQFTCLKTTEQREPFLSVAFTATSHHPYNLPARYQNRWASEESSKMRQCVLYTDFALRQYFDLAKKQPWYNNTIFVITADHVAARTQERRSRYGLDRIRVPILFFDPSGLLPRGIHPGVAQHIDIMPTLLGFLGHDQEYIAFGQDLTNTPAEDTWTFLYHFEPQYIDTEMVLWVGDGNKVSICRLDEPENRRRKLKRSELSQYDQQIKKLRFLTYSCIYRMQHNMMTRGTNILKTNSKKNHED